jgi:hypothetical protein
MRRVSSHISLDHQSQWVNGWKMSRCQQRKHATEILDIANISITTLLQCRNCLLKIILTDDQEENFKPLMTLYNDLLCLCVYMYIFMSICMYTYIYTYTHIYTYIYTEIYIEINIYLHCSVGD